jgi:Mn2+/Fe2+ NRAMP family transporter
MPQAPARRATSESSDVAKLVRLHHRRRGWAWVAIGSVIGLVVYAGIGVNPFENLTGTAETLSVIPVFALLALVLAGLVVVIVDTSRIHRADAAVRVSAKGSVSHYPLYAHAYRYPPRHHGSWVFAIVMLVAMTGITVFFLPSEVNSWAYVAGAENQDTFNPVSYGQACTPRPGAAATR